MNTIDIRWIVRQMPLAALAAIVLALAFAGGGCAERLDGPTGDDAADPDIVPGNDTLSPQHTVRCTLGETVELGASFDWDAQVAGTDDGYAVTYREAGGWDPVVLTLDSDGDSTGPATILPPSDWEPFITSDSDGYAIKSGGVHGPSTGSIYRLNQDSSITSVVRQVWMGGPIDLTETKLKGFALTYDASCTAGPGPWRVSVGSVLEDSTYDDLRIGPCMTYGGWWQGGFAAHDDSAIVLTYEEQRINDFDSLNSTVANVFTDDGGLERIALYSGYRFGSSMWRFANVISTVATDDGFAILWYRQSQDGFDREESWFLTFIGTDGTFYGTREVGEYASDLVWNGQEFGLVRGDSTDDFYTTHFERLDRRGQVIESLEFTSAGNSGWTQRIGAGGDGYAITYSLREGSTSRGIYFTPIVCD